MGSVVHFNAAFCIGFAPQKLLVVRLSGYHAICNDSQNWTITCWMEADPEVCEL
jgi:hypothetical protein